MTRWGIGEAIGPYSGDIAAVVRAVVGAVAVFDGPSVAMLVAPVVSLLFCFCGSGGDGGDEHYGFPPQDSDRYQ